jgi:D-glycero-D-manno-heptose 1,7-bisphosphate phosphatase
MSVKNNKLSKAIFFDRDGVLIHAPVKNGIPKSSKTLDDIKLSEEIENVCNFYKTQFKLIMITNQPDVTRGENTKSNVDEINYYIKKKLQLDKIYVCYCDKDSCPNRKPNPGMILKAKHFFNIDLAESYVVGDRWRDIDAGYNAGCKTILINRNYSENLNFKPDFLITSLIDLFNIIKK